MNDIHVPTITAHSPLCDSCHELPYTTVDPYAGQFVCDRCVEFRRHQ